MKAYNATLETFDHIAPFLADDLRGVESGDEIFLNDRQSDLRVINTSEYSDVVAISATSHGYDYVVLVAQDDSLVKVVRMGSVRASGGKIDVETIGVIPDEVPSAEEILGLDDEDDEEQDDVDDEADDELDEEIEAEPAREIATDGGIATEPEPDEDDEDLRKIGRAFGLDDDDMDEAIEEDPDPDHDLDLEIDRTVDVRNAEAAPDEIVQAVRDAFEASIGYLIDSREIYFHEPTGRQIARFAFDYPEIPASCVNEDAPPHAFVAPYRCRELVDAELLERLPEGYHFEAANSTATGVYRD
jgi:hypothetical protein